MKIVYTGLEGEGKTLLMARRVTEVLKRNKQWKKKFGFVRPVYINIKLNKEIENEYKEYINYWSDVKEIIGKTGCDIFHDEISSHFSALKRDPLPLKVNRWLRQGSKQGVDYYATAQEFHDIHLDWRRRAMKAYAITKIMGSPRGGENKPPVNTIWGACIIKSLNIHPYNEIAPEYIFHSFFPFLFITRNLCNVFNTFEVINPSEELPLEHRERVCHECGVRYITHGGVASKVIWKYEPKASKK